MRNSTDSAAAFDFSTPSEPPVAEQFETMEQQREANLLGMWLFLATEALLFGGMFLAFTVYYLLYPQVFAEAARHLHWQFGTLNTVVLLCSGCSMALAEHAAQLRQRRALLFFLAVTLTLGFGFLTIKGFEYHSEYRAGLVPFLDQPFRFEGPQPQLAALFFNFYFGMTGLHALHMLIGLGLLSVMAVLALRWREPFRIGRQVQISGLYWAFVDIVWIFVYTLLYLIKWPG